MIFGPLAILFGVFTFGWGFNTFNDPNCASVRILFRFRGGDIICYPAGLGDAPIPGNLLAVGILAVGLLMMAAGISSISDSRKRKHAKDENYLSAREILGTVRGQAPAVFSGAEGDLLWSTEQFVFLAAEPLASGLSQLGPISFHDVGRARFRIPVLSDTGFLLEFPGTTLAFTSESGKIKNLKKEIDRFKNANPA
jgi:hypothetical protein